MDIGVMIEGQEGLSWDLWRRIIGHSEDLGFESLWRSDHLLSFFSPPRQDTIDAFISFVLVATESRRIRFGPLVSPVTFRHPSIVGQMAAQLDVLSGGRFIMGVGAGWNRPEHETYGLPFPPARERMDRLEEALRVMEALWEDGPATFEGRYYQLQAANASPKPLQRPLPLLIGGSGERRTLRLVAEHAAEWNFVGHGLDIYRHKREVLERHCADVGRDPATIRHSQMGAFFIGRDEVGMRRHQERIVARMPQLGRYAENMRESVDRGVWLGGTPAQIVEQLGRREEAGITRFMLQHLAADDFETLELLATEVLPQVQRTAQ